MPLVQFLVIPFVFAQSLCCCWNETTYQANGLLASNHGCPSTTALSKSNLCEVGHGASEEAQSLLLFRVGEVHGHAKTFNQERSARAPLIERKIEVALGNRLGEAASRRLSHRLQVMRRGEGLVMRGLYHLGAPEKVSLQARNLR